MSVSDFLTPEDRGRPLWAGCLHCRFQGTCSHYQTYVSKEVLCRAARRSCAAAQYLQEQAETLRQAVTQAGDAAALLTAGEETERALAGLLRAQTDWLNEVSG